MNYRIGISLGDVTGIGPEVTLKALAVEPPESVSQCVIVGDHAILERTRQNLGLTLKIVRGQLSDPLEPGTILVVQPEPSLAGSLQPGSPLASEAALSWLRYGTDRCLANDLSALVTAPVSKESIIRSGVSPSFVGQTEFLSELSGTPRTAMMLLGCDDRNRWLRVALVTTHVPLRLVSSCLTFEKIAQTIELTAQACVDLSLGRARIGVCGLNPHAGEGGEIGDEEIALIRPAVEKASRLGIDVTGPLAADTLFYHAFKGDYDAVVTMYHDQGLVPLKMIGFETGVNWTLGLPFPRTSPDHGPAYNIVGKGIANPGSMSSAIGLAKKLSRLRRNS